MTTVEQLIEASKDARLKNQPKWVQDLVYHLAYRLESQHRYALSVRDKAEEEVDAARKIAAEGPEDSDTSLDLPRSLLGSMDDFEQRPLGRGVNIEFRGAGDEPGEGINAKLLPSGALLIHGINSLAVIPRDSSTVRIEEHQGAVRAR